MKFISRAVSSSTAPVSDANVKSVWSALLSQAVDLPAMNRQDAFPHIGVEAARKLLFDVANQGECIRLPRVSGRHALPLQAQAKSIVERALLEAGSIRCVQHVVRDGVEHAVGEESLREAHGNAEQHLKVVADPDVAHRLPEIVEPQRLIECAGLARKGDRRFVEGVAEEQAPVAVGPTEAALTEVLQHRAQAVAPRELLGRLFRMFVDAECDLFDQLARGARILPLLPSADLRPKSR
jgi:hypothetical protein